MGVLVALFPVLLVAAAAEGGGHAAPATTTAVGESTVLGFRSATEVIAYWRAVLPNTPMPSAILERIRGPPGDKGKGKKMENEHTWYPRTEEEAKKLVHGPSLSSEKILVPEDVLVTPGSVIDLYIDSSATLRAACKSHDEIADHVPMSVKDLSDILAKYAPTSLAMARDIWSTINVCEHARPVKGEQQTCTGSIKTMMEFAASVLGTSDLHAFSSPDVPAEGITSPAQRYKVVAARAVTTPGAKASTMTCHSMEFPYPAYYCHAVNPTRVYEVTLQREKGAAAAQGTPPEMVQALAVCHLDSSGFDARMSFFVERGIKPGDAPACHFLSRGSVLWAPTAWTGPSEQVAAQ